MLPRGSLGWRRTVTRTVILNQIADEPDDGIAADSENHHRRFPTVKRRSNTSDEANHFSHSILESCSAGAGLAVAGVLGVISGGGGSGSVGNVHPFLSSLYP
ncbi:hypothetical protein C2S51_000852 [Perilla frutescens var. frutescens]|nr:hypothetical protein C2S51_000852 [Perilla frutescens var. frutescens]